MPSVIATSHSSRSHAVAMAAGRLPARRCRGRRRSTIRRTCATGRRPATIAPLVKPWRSVCTRTGRPSLHLHARRNRESGSGAAPSADRGSRIASSAIRMRSQSVSIAIDLQSADPKADIANAPGFHESTSAGEPTWPSPISAVRRASSVDTCSGDGCARSSSVHCSTRAGVGSMQHAHDVDRRVGRMRFEIEQDQRAQRFRIAHRRRQLQRAREHRREVEAQRRVAAPRRRDRRARAARPAARAAAPARTTAARALRSAIRARAPLRTAPRRPTAPAAARRRRAPAAATARRARRAARAPRARTTPPARRASECPTWSGSRACDSRALAACPARLMRHPGMMPAAAGARVPGAAGAVGCGLGA